MIIWQLFIAFLEIGVTSFGGGYASLPIIQEVIVERHAWLSMTEMMDIISISQMTPGPIAINAATFVGTKIAGPVGALVASVATVLPQTIFLLIIGMIIFREKELTMLDRALEGLRPAVVGLIAAAVVNILMSSLLTSVNTFQLDLVALFAFAVALLLRFKKLDVFKVVAAGAIVGLAGGAIERFAH